MIKFDTEAWSDAELAFCGAKDSLSMLSEVLFTDGNKVESGACHAAILLIESGLRSMEMGRHYEKSPLTDDLAWINDE